MIKKKLKSGGFINILSENEPPISGEINFTAEEWLHAERLGKTPSDPESDKEFWKVLIEKKSSVPGYSLFQDFPMEKRAPSIAEIYCPQIIERLKGRIKQEESA